MLAVPLTVGDGGAAVADFIAARGIDDVCRASLRRTAEAFDTPIAADLLAGRTPSSREATARFLDGRRGSAASALDDLRAARSWRVKLRLAREHLFPPADYMQKVYAPNSSSPLPWLYLRRALRGLSRTRKN